MVQVQAGNCFVQVIYRHVGHCASSPTPWSLGAVPIVMGVVIPLQQEGWLLSVAAFVG